MSLETISDCAAAIRGGALTRESLVHDAASDRWIKASEHKDVAALLTGSPQNKVAPRKTAEPATPKALRIAAWTAWIIGLGVPPIVAGAHGGDAAFVLGEAIGAGLFCLLIGAIALIFVKTPRSRMTLSLVLGLLLCAAELPRLIQEQADRARLHASARNLQSALSPQTPASTPPSANSNKPDLTPAQSQTATATSLLDVTADFMKDYNRLNERYKRAIDALGAESMIVPETLLNESRLHDASRRLSAWSTFLDSYERAINQVKTNYVAKVEALDLTEADRTAFRKSYSAGKEKADQKLQHFLHVERSMISEVRALYVFMGDRIGLVEVSNGKLKFVTSADADSYNAYIDRITKLADEESVVQNEILKMNKEGVAKMQDFAKQAAGE